MNPILRAFFRGAGRALTKEGRRSAGIREPRPTDQRTAEALERLADVETVKYWTTR